MYFYYFLDYQLEAREDLSLAQKEARAENTYCLALGYTLFQLSYRIYKDIYKFILFFHIFNSQ